MSLNVESARHQMVAQQVRAWDVLDPVVLRTLSEVPRERFVPVEWRSLAFADTAIPLPDGQRMMTPQVEGRLLQSLEIGSADTILEIGTGSGFIAACLARLGARVTSLEIRPALAESARRALAEVGVGHCEVEAADAFDWRPSGAFHCIAITGSLPVHEAPFEQWLAPGGRMFVVVGQLPIMEALLIRRTGASTFTRESLFETVLDPLDHAPQPERFVF
jgi:protein-L-isoaspartate(D-aspartate) O-methyltransferase